MAVSVDTVYQKVLAFANKEQRGYITPQEFNLFADQAQMEIFEQYFYDVNQFKRIPGNDTVYSDVLTNLEEKISIFEAYDKTVSVVNEWGDIILGDDITDLYRLGMVRVDYNTEPRLRVAEQIQLHELNKYGTSPLGKWTKSRPVYTRYNTVGGRLDRIKIYPYPAESTILNLNGDPLDRVRVSYLKNPFKPNWGYVVVNNKPLYNSNTSTDFELHTAEESELVYRILTYMGIAIEKPGLAQAAIGLETTKQQQEKQ